MTTILGYQDIKNGTAYIADDSAIIEDGKMHWLAESQSKIGMIGEWLIGYAGNHRAGQILLHKEQLPESNAGSVKELDTFMTNVLIPYIQELWSESDYTPTSEDPTELLIISNGIIYEVGFDGSWTRDKRGVYGIGSGSAYGIGALKAYINSAKSQSHRMILHEAIKVAGMYDTNTGELGEVYMSRIPEHWRQ